MQLTVQAELSCAEQSRSLRCSQRLRHLTALLCLGCKKTKNHKKFLFKILNLATALGKKKKKGKSGSCCGCFIIRIINKHCSGEGGQININKQCCHGKPLTNTDTDPFDSPEAKNSFAHLAPHSSSMTPIQSVLSILHRVAAHSPRPILITGTFLRLLFHSPARAL